MQGHHALYLLGHRDRQYLAVQDSMNCIVEATDGICHSRGVVGSQVGGCILIGEQQV